MADPRPSVLITGGAKRIGAAMARRYGEAGWHVVIHFRGSGDEAAALAAELPHAETIACDIADIDDAVAMIETLAKRLDNWRALINSAGIFELDDATALDPAIFARAMRVNAEAPARMAQAYLAGARATGGRRVVMLTDQKLANPNPDFFSYTMSKHALSATVPMLAMGAAGPEDRVYALAPGAILPSHDQTTAEAEISHRLNPLGRRTGVQEVAEAAFMLGQGTLASGQTLYVDSGQHLLAQPRDVIHLVRMGDRG